MRSPNKLVSLAFVAIVHLIQHGHGLTNLPTCPSSVLSIDTVEGAKVSVNTTVEYPLLESASEACFMLGLKGTNEGKTAFIQIEMSFEFDGTGDALEWQYSIHYAMSPKGNMPSQQRVEFLRGSSGKWLASLMIPSQSDKVTFMRVHCARSKELCDKITGKLTVRQAVTMHIDPCGPKSVHSSKACSACTSNEACGWCDDAGEFGGCWEGTLERPRYDNKEVCGKVSKRKVPEGVKDYHVWTFDTTQTRCIRRPSTDGYFLIATIIVVVTACCISSVVMYHCFRALRSGTVGKSSISSLVQKMRGDSRPNRGEYSGVSRLDEFDEDLDDDY